MFAAHELGWQTVMQVFQSLHKLGSGDWLLFRVARDELKELKRRSSQDVSHRHVGFRDLRDVVIHDSMLTDSMIQKVVVTPACVSYHIHRAPPDSPCRDRTQSASKSQVMPEVSLTQVTLILLASFCGSYQPDLEDWCAHVTCRRLWLRVAQLQRCLAACQVARPLKCYLTARTNRDQVVGMLHAGLLENPARYRLQPMEIGPSHDHRTILTRTVKLFNLSQTAVASSHTPLQRCCTNRFAVDDIILLHCDLTR
eukprot:1525446-Prymnesium_polylepis.1